jgi:hypothetical protein
MLHAKCWCQRIESTCCLVLIGLSGGGLLAPRLPLVILPVLFVSPSTGQLDKQQT